MNKLFKFFSQDKNRLRIQKSDSGSWMVKKGFSILYIGTKEKCQIYMNQGQMA
ncbi:MAG: hypothetical protein RIM99_18325 [Cyclobacteriaceae bacterium]